MCVILCIAVIMNIIKIQNNSLASLLNTEQKRGTVPSVKASVIGVIAGLICFVFAIILFSKVYLFGKCYIAMGEKERKMV